MSSETLIASAVRTPIGSFLGGLKTLSAPQLGGIAIAEAVRRSGLSAERVEECLMGCVLTGGMGQAPARQAAHFGGLPRSVCATTVNRVCGSSLKTVMLADQMLRAQDASCIVAGGMESMSSAPYLLFHAREGFRMGHQQAQDSMILDGLWDVSHQNHMGNSAELCARTFHLSREAQDAFAKTSYERAMLAWNEGKFREEVVPIALANPKRKGEDKLMDRDEEPWRAVLAQFGELRPAFEKHGTITAANASSLADGASALVLVNPAHAKNAQQILGRIVAHASFAQEPEWFTTAPVGAVKAVLKKAGRKIGDIDLFEVNEAFSVVALQCAQELEIPSEQLNIRGGAVALGHPLGASGARILTTLLYSLRSQKKRLGIATACIGGGEASAILVEAYLD